MKNQIYGCIFCVSALLFGCNNTHTKKTAQAGQAAVKYEQCYTAVFQKDSAFLQLDTMAQGKVKGHLVIKYGEIVPPAAKKEYYDGEIDGKFTGDTLFADYRFTNAADKGIYQNPVALLKRDGKLLMGSGATENYLGKTWFVNHKAINFDKSRFQFVPGDCK